MKISNHAFCYILLIVISIISGCGGGGGGGGQVASPSTKTAISDQVAKESAQKSIAITRQILVVAGVESQGLFSSSRISSSRIRTAFSTVNYNNQYDSSSGCSLNGSIIFDAETSTSSAVSGTVVKTSCNTSFENGSYTYSGHITSVNATTSNFNVTTTFNQDSTSLVMTIPTIGNYDSTTEIFTPSSNQSLTINGTDADNFTYTNLKFTQTADQGFTVAGTIRDGSGYTLIFKNTKLNTDGSAVFNFTTNNDISGSLSLKADGSISGMFTQSSSSAVVSTCTWDRNGNGTIRYSDGDTESIALCGYACCGDDVCTGQTPYCMAPNSNASACVACTESSQCGVSGSCSNNTCVTCSSHVSKTCSSNDVYWVNSCGDIEDIYEACASGSSCQSASCQDIAIPFQLNFAATDVEFDSARNKIYVSDKANKKLYFVNLGTGQVEKYFVFTHMPEHITMTPDGSMLYVALLTREHSAYWFDEDGHDGYIAEFDLNAGVKNKEMYINEDPGDIVVTSNDKLVVASGSGQWTKIKVYDTSTGEELGSTSRSVYYGDLLALHPDEQWVYAADNGISPSDIEKMDISGSGITYLYDSPYHGDHRMDGNVYVFPDGNHVVTRGGDIFTSTDSQGTDMVYVQALSSGNIEALAFDTTENTIFTVEGSSLKYYNTITFENVGSQSLSGNGDFVGVAGGYVYVLRVETGVTSLDQISHPCVGCGSNTAPTASFSVTPSSGGNTETVYSFNAGNSTDSEESSSSLSVRWDWESDGVYDTSFSTTKVQTYQYNVAGTKNVTMEVKDSGGLTDSLTITVNVAQGTDSGSTGGGGTAFELQFAATDVEFDSARNKMYVSDKANKKLYFVNLGTGQVEKYFVFTHMPEHITMTPDGSMLYVALLTREHSPYWFDRDDAHEGYIAEFDLNAGTKTKEFHIDEDPGDIVVTSNDKLVVAGGSGQWTYVKAYDVNSEEELEGTSWSIYNGDLLSLHPDEQWVYAADNGISPSDIEKMDISGSGITYLYDSPYHGDHRMKGNVYVFPDGNHVVTRGGDIFTSTDSQSTDMVYVQALSFGIIEALAFDTTENTIFTVEGSSLKYYSISSFSETGSTTLSSSGSFVGVSATRVFVLRLVSTKTYIDSFLKTSILL